MANENNDDRRPVLIRHRYSGVWIGYVNGKGSFPHLLEIEGRRIWQWRGGRLECSQLAVKGCVPEDRLGEWELVEIDMSPGAGIVELRTIERKVVEHAKTLPSDQV
jgi:hypothetical protein